MISAGIVLLLPANLIFHVPLLKRKNKGRDTLAEAHSWGPSVAPHRA